LCGRRCDDITVGRRGGSLDARLRARPAPVPWSTATRTVRVRVPSPSTPAGRPDLPGLYSPITVHSLPEVHLSVSSRPLGCTDAPMRGRLGVISRSDGAPSSRRRTSLSIWSRGQLAGMTSGLVKPFGATQIDVSVGRTASCKHLETSSGSPVHHVDGSDSF